ncbi:MAG: anti-sigma factor [Chloroflexota bacterium]
MDPPSGTGMLMCHNMPPLEQGHAYQVWFVRSKQAGLRRPDLAGRLRQCYTLIQVPTDLQDFDSVGLTDEPGSGSRWPTTPQVIGTPLKDSVQ